MVAPLANATQVGDSEQNDSSDGQLDLVRIERGESRSHRGDTCRNTDRDREDVIAQQRSSCQQARSDTEIVLGDDVCPTPVRIGADRLTVGEADDRQQKHDRQSVRQNEGIGRCSGQDENAQDLFGRVGGRGERVRRENGQRFCLPDPLVGCFGSAERPTDQRAPQLHPRLAPNARWFHQLGYETSRLDFPERKVARGNVPDKAISWMSTGDARSLAARRTRLARFHGSTSGDSSPSPCSTPVPGVYAPASDRRGGPIERWYP